MRETVVVIKIIILILVRRLERENPDSPQLGGLDKPGKKQEGSMSMN